MPTPAMAVAFTALLVALTGTAIALPGTNTVDSGDIRKGGVKTRDLGRNAVTSPKVKNGSLRGGDVRNETLTGLDIDESTLGKVASAGAADSATTANSANTANSADSVDGMSFARINYRGDTGTAATPILTLNGLTVSASCSAGPTLAISATTAVDGALLHWAVNQLGTPPNSVALYDEEDPFNTGISEPIADDNGGTSGAARLHPGHPDLRASGRRHRDRDVHGGGGRGPARRHGRLLRDRPRAVVVLRALRPRRTASGGPGAASAPAAASRSPRGSGPCASPSCRPPARACPGRPACRPPRRPRGRGR